MDLIEVNFDGIVGPTHHYGGLGHGNLASQSHVGQVSNPRGAALQGLDKMACVAALADPGKMRQAILPPQLRPSLKWLRRLGMTDIWGPTNASLVQQDAALLSAAWSASSMWTANAATCSPVSDSMDRRTHLTIANLISSPHRSIEARETTRLFRAVFSDDHHFCIHDPLPGGVDFRDEGAANHMRFCDSTGVNGIQVFVHGGTKMLNQAKFIARQSVSASQSVARLHGLSKARTLFWQQHPQAIDAGAFHNDVVATSYGNVLLYHELAFIDSRDRVEELQQQFGELTGQSFVAIEVTASELSLEEAVSSYLFNCQLIPRPGGTLAMLCPVQCRELAAAWNCLDRILDSQPLITECHFMDLRESMWNGGGPACLRLRVPLSENAIRSLPAGIFWTKSLDERLRRVIQSHYRTELTVEDLRSPEFAVEAQAATREVLNVLGFDPSTIWNSQEQSQSLDRGMD